MEEFAVVLIILGLIAVALWVYAIYDIVKGTFQGSIEKAIWLIVVIFFPILGAILYLIFGRSRKSNYNRKY